MFCADSLWLRETCFGYDEPLQIKQQHTTDFQPNGPDRVIGGCHGFEAQLAAVIGLRGLHGGDKFELFSNKHYAGNFCNLVYTANGRRYFLQLQHADSPDTRKLTTGEWVTLLLKSFKSYCDIKHGDTFKDAQFYNSQFIIYTNKELTPALLRHKRRPRKVDILFETRDKVKIFSFSPDDKNKGADVYTLLKNSVEGNKDFYFSSDRKMVSQFLNQVIIVASRKGKGQLDDELCKEIEEHDAIKVSRKTYMAEVRYLKTRVATWLKKGKESMTAEMFRNWLQEAKTEACRAFVKSLFVSCTKEFVTTGIHFANSEISRLQAELSNKRAVHLRSDALTLCSILLLDCLPQSKRIFVNFQHLQGHTKEMLHAWLGGVWEWLIVFCDSSVRQSDITSKCHEIYEIIKTDHSTKSVIILTACSVQQISNFFPIEHNFNFEQLSKKSQEIVLDKKIDFQGCEMTMRSVLQRHGNVQHVLGPELVTDLITEVTTVNIGDRLQTDTDRYAPIPLEREIYLQLNVLGNSDSYPDIFAVSGMEKKELVKIVPSYEIVGKFSFVEDPKTGKWNESYNKFKMSRFIELKSQNLRLCFSKLCEKHSGKTLHWLDLKKGCLLWKESRGSIDSLINYVDSERTRGDKQIITEFMKRGSCEVKVEYVWNLSERTVLVVDESELRKSCTTQVAWNTKLGDPASWVVRINWNNHTTKLQDIDVATFNFDSLVDLLCSAAFPTSKYTGINSSLLKQALQNSGNVTVLMDEFDEISPNYADVIVSELMKTKVRRVWVTSRPEHRKRLEKELSVAAFTRTKLSLEWLKEKQHIARKTGCLATKRKKRLRFLPYSKLFPWKMKHATRKHSLSAR